MSDTASLPTEAELDARFEPRIVAFFCNWCTYTASDLAGVSRMQYLPNTRVIRVMCSGRIDPQFVLAAFRQGADGVLIGGCHPGDCHYQEGNYKCMRRIELLRRLLVQMGIEPERLRLEWISASEGDRLRDVTNEMVEQVRALGPLGLDPIPHPEEHGVSPGPGPSCAQEPESQPQSEPESEPVAVAALGEQSCQNPKSASTGAPPAEDAKKRWWTWR